MKFSVSKIFTFGSQSCKKLYVYWRSLIRLLAFYVYWRSIIRLRATDFEKFYVYWRSILRLRAFYVYWRSLLRLLAFYVYWRYRGGGGERGKESSSFGMIEYGTPQRGRVCEGVSPYHGGDFLEIWVLKTRFWVRYKFLLNIKSSSKCIWLQYKG